MFHISKIKMSLSVSLVLLALSITGCQSVGALLTPTATTPTDAPATSISAGEIISPTTSIEVTEPSPTETPISPTNTPPSIMTSNATQDLYVYTEATREDIYIIKGSKLSEYNVGDNLVVYGEITPGTPIVIALLKVIAKNPDSLSAQVLLIHPSFPVRTNLRVDSRLDYISESELIPFPEFALGYLLRPGRVRLRPNNGVKENSVLQALNFEIVDGVQLDALPFVPAIKMRVQAVGAEGIIASVELIEGNWPLTGTIVSGVIVEPTPLPPTSTLEPTGTPVPPTYTDTPAPPTPTNTDTPMAPTPTDTPTGRHIGNWLGQTKQGQTISFQVVEDGFPSSYEAVANVEVSFQFDSPCPLGLATFSSFEYGHIYEPPSYPFSIINIRGSNTLANISGGFKSNTIAEGTLEIHDERDSLEGLKNRCPLISTIQWTATKQ